MTRLALLTPLLVAAGWPRVALADDPGRAGYWIWHESVDSAQGVPSGTTIYLRRHLDVAGPIAEAWLRISADDEYELYVNGEVVGSGDDWAQPDRYDLTPLLRPGDNVLAAEAANDLAGPAGVFFSGRVIYDSGESFDFASDSTTLAAAEEIADWELRDADESAFTPARQVASRFGGPWGGGAAPPNVDATMEAWETEWQRIFAAQRTLPEPLLIPRPKHLDWCDESLPLVAQGRGLVRIEAGGVAQAEVCAEFLRNAAGWLLGEEVSWDDPPAGATITLALDEKLTGPEAYTIRWDAAKKVVRLAAATDRGLTWGTYTLAQLMMEHDDEVTLKLADIRDAPAVPMRGIVTGVPLSMLPWAAYLRYNVNGIGVGVGGQVTPEHGRLRREALRLGIDLVLFSHPPQEFSYSNPEEVESYCARVREAAEEGFRYLSLDVDDFPNETVTEADIAAYGEGLVALGRGQMDLVRRMHAAADGRLRLIFCPRVYHDPRRVGPTPREAPPEELEYRTMVGELPDDISIWTTQPKVAYLRELNGVYDRKPLVWHNYWLDFSQCGEFYYLAYPQLSRAHRQLAEGYWVELDFVRNPGRVNYLIHAATLWNPNGRATWTEAFSREFGSPAADDLVSYAQLTGCDEDARGIMADWWDQPPTHVGMALATTAGGWYTRLEANPETLAVLRAQAANAREAMDLPLRGLDEDTAAALRANAEKIALNAEIHATRLTLPNADRAQSLAAVGAALDRLAALGAREGYIDGWRQWLTDAEAE